MSDFDFRPSKMYVSLLDEDGKPIGEPQMIDMAKFTTGITVPTYPKSRKQAFENLVLDGIIKCTLPLPPKFRWRRWLRLGGA